MIKKFYHRYAPEILGATLAIVGVASVKPICWLIIQLAIMTGRLPAGCLK